MRAAPPIVSADEITAEWIGAALGRDIVEATTEPVGTGQMANSSRVTMTDADGPAGTVVVKYPGDTESARSAGANQAYPTEVRFYREVASTVAIRVPACHHAVISDDGRAFAIVLEDLAPARQGDQIAGGSVAEVLAAAVNLAGLHGPRWCDPTLHDIDGLSLFDAATAEFIGDLLVGAVDPFLARYGDRVDSADAVTIRASAEATGAWLVQRQDCFGLVHGDYRLDNLLFPLDDPSGVAAVDWQTVGIGLPARDLSYLVATSLEPAQRQRVERQVVDTYAAALDGHGVTDHPPERGWDDYRFGQLQGPLITVLGATYADRTERGDDMFMAMVRRSCAAIRDLDTLSLVS